MLQIEYNLFVRDGRNASSKAKQDVSVILNRAGFCKLYNPSTYRWIRILQQFFSILFIPKGTVLFIQYKANISFFYRLLRYKKRVHKIAIIHDLESLRGLCTINEEITILNSFQTIISHNPQMTIWLRSKGLDREIIDLNIFDYLLDDSIKCNTIYNKNTVFFAGNLVKSKFLMDLNLIKNVIFNIYGGEFDGIKRLSSQGNVSYKGSFSPDHLIAIIEGGWGLVWDGDSIETCSGATGEYMKYNNPHKVSMCIVSERPVIIWSKSAMAEYILSHKLGIVVESLTDLPDRIKHVSDNEYNEMLSNIRLEKKDLVKGKKLGEILSGVVCMLR